MNLKDGMGLIEKAVALKPDDGYIVDSLGWAHFKLGNYAESVRFLERAVELKPQDPVLNDHLGDALWRVGREREAKFQWDQALTLDPRAGGGREAEEEACSRGCHRPPRRRPLDKLLLQLLDLLGCGSSVRAWSHWNLASRSRPRATRHRRDGR